MDLADLGTETADILDAKTANAAKPNKIIAALRMLNPLKKDPSITKFVIQNL